ncbi:MAG TPA: hypothetical protein VIM69_11590, partial [Opitutaceae bacterium]
MLPWYSIPAWAHGGLRNIFHRSAGRSTLPDIRIHRAVSAEIILRIVRKALIATLVSAFAMVPMAGKAIQGMPIVRSYAFED